MPIHRDYSARDFGLYLAARMKYGGVYVGLWEQIPLLEYLQIVEHRRADLELQNAVLLHPERLRRVMDRAWTQGRAVYVSTPELAPFADVEFDGIVSNNLYRVAVSKRGAER